MGDDDDCDDYDNGYHISPVRIQRLQSIYVAPVVSFAFSVYLTLPLLPLLTCPLLPDSEPSKILTQRFLNKKRDWRLKLKGLVFYMIAFPVLGLLFLAFGRTWSRISSAAGKEKKFQFISWFRLLCNTCPSFFHECPIQGGSHYRKRRREGIPKFSTRAFAIL